MKITNHKLAIEQLDRKLAQVRPLELLLVPERGWVHAIRVTLKMSLRQLAGRMKMTPQSVKEIEEREANGSITMKSLRDAADALGMKLVYGLLPKEETLEKMIEQRATTVSRSIVLRTSTSMELEDQGVSQARLEKAIQAKAEEIVRTLPRFLWD